MGIPKSVPICFKVAALFELMTEDSSRHEHRPSREGLGGAADLAERNRLFLGAVQESDAAEGYELSSEANGISPTASCAWPLCRLSPLIASAVTSICSGGKRDRLCLRWSRCGVAGDSQAVQHFHSRSGSSGNTREVHAVRADQQWDTRFPEAVPPRQTRLAALN